MTEIEEKKDYLRGYERAVRQMERINERINEMRSNRIGMGINYDGMPHTHNHSDLSDYAAMIDKELRKCMKARYKRIMLFKEISDKIERMDNEDEKDFKKEIKKGLPAPLVEYVQSLSKILFILYPKCEKNQCFDGK